MGKVKRGGAVGPRRSTRKGKKSQERTQGERQETMERVEVLDSSVPAPNPPPQELIYQRPPSDLQGYPQVCQTSQVFQPAQLYQPPQMHFGPQSSMYYGAQPCPSTSGMQAATVPAPSGDMESGECQLNQPLRPLSGVHDPLGVYLSQATREKIMKGQYVNMYYMLDRQGEKEAGEGTSYHQAHVGSDSKLLLKEVRPKQIRNINEWTSAFHVYMYVYLQAHPSRALELLKYCENIRFAARAGGDSWIRYDHEFRLRMGAAPTRCWGSVDTELWCLLIRPTGRPGQSYLSTDVSSASQGKQGKGKLKYCFRFQDGKCEKGADCRFAKGHICRKCQSKSHGDKACKKASPEDKGSNSSQY